MIDQQPSIVKIPSFCVLPEIRCKILDYLQTSLEAIFTTFPDKEVKIIGGSACSILDHLYAQKPLSLRDIDLAITMNRCIGAKETGSFTHELLSTIPGMHTCDSLEDRPRVPSEVPLKEDASFSAGIGFFLYPEDREMPMLDITLYHHQEDLAINGFLAQDRIAIVLKKDRPFAQFVSEAKLYPLETMIEKGWIEQPPEAYQNWNQDKIQIVNWDEISSRPHLATLRLVRSINKKGLLQQLVTPTIMRNDLQKQWVDVNQSITSNFHMEYGFQARLLERCLKDNDAALALKALSIVGIFDKWLPYVNDTLSWLQVDEIQGLLPTNPEASYETRLLSLVADKPFEQQLHTLFIGLGGPSNIKDTAARIWERLQDQFSDWGNIDQTVCKQLIENRCESDQKKFTLSFKRILSSTSLHLNEKCNLLLRLLPETCDHLQALFPNAPKEKIELFWSEIEKPRIGFFTGIFDPFINVHLEIVAHAIEQMALDRVIVLPAFLLSKNCRPYTPWNDRYAMIAKGLEGHPVAEVIDASLIEDNSTIGSVFSDLQSKTSAVWVHIAGTDAFERFKHMGLMDSYVQRKTRYFVMQRIGVKATALPPKYQEWVSHFNPPLPLGIEGAFSSSDVRQMVKGGQNISRVVHENVLDYIQTNGLYALPHKAMQMPWQIVAPEELTDLIRKQLPYAHINTTAHVALEKEKPSLVFHLEDQEDKKHIKIVYQLHTSSSPVILEADCDAENIEESAIHLLQTLIHNLIGHSSIAK